MIFPILRLLRDWRKAPVTWLIVLLNLGVLLYTTNFAVQPQKDLDRIMSNEFFLRTQGQIYAGYLESHPAVAPSAFLTQLAHEVRQGRNDRAEILGDLAFRDFGFMNSASHVSFPQDVVALKIWKGDLAKVQLLEDELPSFTLGLNAQDPSLTKWVTYIFVHSGWGHFIGNMIFMVIFGVALEVQIGGLGLLVSFLLSGIFGAGVFALLTGVTSSPLVGASGAISGLMTLYCVLNWFEPQRFFYWLFLPFRGFMGILYLPAWTIVALWVTGDLAGYLGTIPELGGVAHAAHLGGEMAGALIAVILFTVRKFIPLEKSEPVRPRPPMGRLIPFLPPVRSNSKAA